jgi:hypothetical protein
MASPRAAGGSQPGAPPVSGMHDHSGSFGPGKGRQFTIASRPGGRILDSHWSAPGADRPGTSAALVPSFPASIALTVFLELLSQGAFADGAEHDREHRPVEVLALGVGPRMAAGFQLPRAVKFGPRGGFTARSAPAWH